MAPITTHLALLLLASVTTHAFVPQPLLHHLSECSSGSAKARYVKCESIWGTPIDRPIDRLSPIDPPPYIHPHLAGARPSRLRPRLRRRRSCSGPRSCRARPSTPSSSSSRSSRPSRARPSASATRSVPRGWAARSLLWPSSRCVLAWVCFCCSVRCFFVFTLGGFVLYEHTHTHALTRHTPLLLLLLFPPSSSSSPPPPARGRF